MELNSWQHLTIIIIAIIIIIWQLGLSYQSTWIHSQITGFWEAPSEFLLDVGLSSFTIYIGDSDLMGNRPCYLLAKQDEGDIILNEPTTANISIQWFAANNWSSDLNIPKYLNITFNDLETDFLPATQEIRLYLNCLKMVLYQDDTIYAVLYKNTILSDLKNKDSE